MERRIGKIDSGYLTDLITMEYDPFNVPLPYGIQDY